MRFLRRFSRSDTSTNLSASAMPFSGENQQAIQALLDQGVAQKRAGDFGAAKISYLRAIQLAPAARVGYYSLAKVHYLTGEQQRALVTYLSLYSRVTVI